MFDGKPFISFASRNFHIGYIRHSGKKVQIFIKDIKEHVPGSCREHHVCIPDRNKFKKIRGSSQHQRGNGFKGRTEYQLKVRYILCGLQNFIRNRLILHLKLQAEHMTGSDDQYVRVDPDHTRTIEPQFKNDFPVQEGSIHHPGKIPKKGTHDVPAVQEGMNQTTLIIQVAADPPAAFLQGSQPGIFGSFQELLYRTVPAGKFV